MSDPRKPAPLPPSRQLPPPPADPAEQFLEEQRKIDEDEIIQRLHDDAVRRLRELKQQVPDGRHEFPDQRKELWAPGEFWPGQGTAYGDYGLV